jgi:hypothetical protein
MASKICGVWAVEGMKFSRKRLTSRWVYVRMECSAEMNSKGLTVGAWADFKHIRHIRHTTGHF